MYVSVVGSQHLCSVARALDVLGQKWTLLLLREAVRGRTRFAEFERNGIPPATLGQRLRDLVDAGLFERRTYREEGERARDEYVPTPMARDAVPVLVALAAWGDEHDPLPGGPAMLYVTKDEKRPVHVELVDDDGNRVDPAQVRVATGPGYEAAVGHSAA